MTRRGWQPRTLRWRVYLLVGGLLVLLVATASTTTVVRLRLSAVGHRLTTTLRPAQVATADMIQAYIDEETGERGYLLTRDPVFLQPYDSGELEVRRVRTQLGRQFTDDSVTMRLLDEIDQAAHAWRVQVIDPEIAAFRRGALTGDALVDSVGLGKDRFDALRAKLGELQDRINLLVTGALQDSDAAQSTANNVTVAAAIVAALLAFFAAWQLRTSFAIPLNKLVAQVRRVASGDLDQSVDVSGPLEVATVGETVEAMRVRILAESARSASAAQQLARYEEAERIASSLGDTVIRQLFTTSLALQSTAARYPAAAPVLAGAISDLDHALKDLQTAIFELSSAPSWQPLGNQVIDLVDQLEAGLGVAPEVQLAGSVDSDRLRPVATDVVAVVRDVLGAIVRPAAGSRSTISLSTDDDMVRLLITGGGVPAGVETGAVGEVRERATRLGGTCTVERTGDSVTFDWQVPVPAGRAVMPPGTSPAGDS
ncbi:MAG TPA: CHASE3 domain-containing protein [Pseudonocardiaceae bacterium]|nr:CHASE3 domain-containing protein [Pseudonocardiaceae bacterium]